MVTMTTERGAPKYRLERCYSELLDGAWIIHKPTGQLRTAKWSLFVQVTTHHFP